jgi:hypothetical protein
MNFMEKQKDININEAPERFKTCGAHNKDREAIWQGVGEHESQ